MPELKGKYLGGSETKEESKEESKEPPKEPKEEAKSDTGTKQAIEESKKMISELRAEIERLQKSQANVDKIVKEFKIKNEYKKDDYVITKIEDGFTIKLNKK